MHAMASLRNMLLLSLVVGLMLTNVGCPPAPNPEAVLAGTWTLTEGTPPNPQLTQVLLDFNSNGDLVSVSYIFAGAAKVTRTLTNTTTTVSGTAVTIDSTTAGFTLLFTGNLNADNTVITGNASWTLIIGNITITAPTGPATLTKGVVTPIVGNAAAGQTLWNAECIGCHNGTIAATAANSNPNDVVNDLGTISGAMTGIILTDQEVADVKAFLLTQ